MTCDAGSLQLHCTKGAGAKTESTCKADAKFDSLEEKGHTDGNSFLLLEINVIVKTASLSRENLHASEPVVSQLCGEGEHLITCPALDNSNTIWERGGMEIIGAGESTIRIMDLVPLPLPNKKNLNIIAMNIKWSYERPHHITS